MADIRSSQRLDPARAPRLRRIADLIDGQAARTRSPARARGLACAMRLRATELECGADGSYHLDEFTDELRELGFQG
jgi:hypothetical protein